MKTENQQIQHKLHGIWRRQQRLFHSRGACQALLWIVGLVLLDLAVDWLLELPGWARVLLVCANLAILAWIGYQQWWRFLRCYDPLRASLAAERVHPELNSLLVSYVQLAEQNEASAYSSPQMTAAMCKQAVQTAAPMDFRGVIDFGQLTKLATIAAVVVLGFGVSTLFAGPFYRVLAIRLINPASELTYPTRTRIDRESITGDVTIRQGDPLELAINVELDSEVPDHARLEIRYGDGPWERVVVAGDEAGRFAYPIRQANGSFVYRFRAGDARTKYFDATVVPAPQIVESSVTLQYPEYTKQDAENLSSLNFEALEGTTVQWEIQCDVALSAAQISCEPGETIEMTIDANDPRVARATLTVTESLAYEFHWTEQQHGYDYADKVRYSIRAKQDEAPLIDILPPTPVKVATLAKNLDIRFRVRDDYGLTEAWVVYRINDGVEHEHALGGLSGRQEVKEIEWKPSEWISKLSETDTLTYAIQATDNRASKQGPNTGRSKWLKLQFVSREEYLKFVQETRDELFQNIKGIQEEEVESASDLKTLKAKVKP